MTCYYKLPVLDKVDVKIEDQELCNDDTDPFAAKFDFERTEQNYDLYYCIAPSLPVERNEAVEPVGVRCKLFVDD